MPARRPREFVGRFTELGSKNVYQTLALALSHNRELLAAFCENDVFLFNATKREQLWCRRVRRGSRSMFIWAGAISGDGRAVAGGWDAGGSGGAVCGVTVWRGRDWKETIEIPLPRGAQPVDVVLSRAGDWLAVSSQDNLIRVFALAEGTTQIAEMDEHAQWPRALALTRDGRLMASCDSTGGTRLWHTRDWRLAARLKKPADFISFDAAGRYLVSCNGSADEDRPRQHVALVWDLSKLKVVRELRVPGYNFRCAVLSPDGLRVACGIENPTDVHDQSAILLDVASGKELSRLLEKFVWFNDFAFLSPSGRTIAAAVFAYSRKPVILWEAGRSKR